MLNENLFAQPLDQFKPLIDPYMRRINYLRVSVTDRCDFRCQYCMSENMVFLPKKDLMTLEELDRLCTIFIQLGVTKIRLTGGEPLVRRGLLDFIKNMSRHLNTGALSELTLTTNGSQLTRLSKPLYDLGVRRLNVSLDTLDPDKFKQVTRWGNFSKVINGIMTAKECGLKIKINTVALKGFNENELFDLTSWCAKNEFDITFIEVMPMGDIGNENRIGQFWSLKNLRQRLEERYTLIDTPERSGGPATYIKVWETNQKIGFITPLTHNFCESCNRVRVTCTGELFMCLGQEDKVDLKTPLRKYPNDDRPTIETIRRAIEAKPKGHDFDYSRQTIQGQVTRYMNHTGG